MLAQEIVEIISDSSEPAIVEIETEINEHTIDLEIDLDRREIDKKEEEIVKTFVVCMQSKWRNWV